jgi:hypothetical protein
LGFSHCVPDELSAVPVISIRRRIGASSASITSSWRQVIAGPRAVEGENFRRQVLISTSPPQIRRSQKTHPLVFPYLPWIVVGVEKVAICLEWSGTPE